MRRGRGKRRPSAGKWIKGTKESQALDEIANERIHRDHAFGLQFAERHMNRPLIRAGGTEAIEGQIGALADAHAGVANQQEGITAQIVAAEELLLQELVLLGGKRTGQSLRQAGNVLAADEMSEFEAAVQSKPVR